MAMTIGQLVRSGVAVSCVVALTIACSDASAPATVDKATATSPFVLSNAHAGFAGSASSDASLSVAGTVAYVALPPGAIPNSERVELRVRPGGSTTSVIAVDGGMDPVPVAASPGDSLDIAVHRTTSGAPIAFPMTVPRNARPIVVRTSPPPNKRDVPLNMSVVIVFSEPIATSTVTATTVYLSRGTTRVPGDLTFADAANLTALFTPSSPLDPATDYSLTITSGVADLDGQTLETAVHVPFTTAASGAEPVSAVALTPLSALVLIGQTAAMTATATTVTGDTLRDPSVVWSSSAPHIVSVSQTGIALGVSVGSAVIAATSQGQRGTGRITVARPVASVEVTPPTVTVGTGSTARLSAVLRDASSNALTDRIAAWASSDPSVATVDAGGLVAGVAPGLAIVTASADGKKGSAVVTVRFELTAASLAFTVQPSGSGAGGLVSPAIRVTVRDQLGSVATNYNGEVRLALGDNSGNAELLGDVSAMAQSGVAMFTNVRVSQEGTGYTLVATALDLRATSAPFDVAPEPMGQIAFDRQTETGKHIYIMNTDGSGVRQLTNEPGSQTWPTWSPDGSKIAFVAYGVTEPGRLVVMNADGSNRVVITGPDLSAVQPAWSPDGSRIAFSRTTDLGGTEICVVNADGSGLTLLFPGEFGVDNLAPSWSTDGSKIAFVWYNYAWVSIYVMNADGSGARPVTDQQPYAFDMWSPVWVQDGRILFWSGWARPGITVTRSDWSGAKKIALSVVAIDYTRVGWSPRGSRIVFEGATGTPNGADIYVTKANGSGAVRLTTDGESRAPAWRPRRDP
jgi:hypothetical protein